MFISGAENQEELAEHQLWSKKWTRFQFYRSLYNGEWNFLCFNTFDTSSGTCCEVLSDKSDKFSIEITQAFYSVCVKLSN